MATIRANVVSRPDEVFQGARDQRHDTFMEKHPSLSSPGSQQGQIPNLSPSRSLEGKVESWNGGKWKRENCGGCTFPLCISSAFLGCHSPGLPPLPSPLCARARTRTRSGPLPVRFRCLDLPARAASLVPSLALESLEIEIRFSRQYFAWPTDRPTAPAGCSSTPCCRAVSLPPSSLKWTAARARFPSSPPCLLRCLFQPPILHISRLG